MIDVHAINRRMVALWGEKRWVEAAELARSLPDGDLIWGAYADLWWHVCEDLGDAVVERDVQLAARLYRLALASHVKQGTLATGSGEGLASKSHQERIEAKLRALSHRV